ncbi:HAD hydrolase family protein, partial [uncultured Akkermansia sp.]|uniref:HAD family hydrolase n=1 Tax=uncultured Akkermansia sp. TaxID=512294 RepID=UPI0031B7ED47
MDSVKLIASDMDGTLLNGKGELAPAFFSLFEKLERRGIRFAAAKSPPPDRVGRG